MRMEYWGLDLAVLIIGQVLLKGKSLIRRHHSLSTPSAPPKHKLHHRTETLLREQYFSSLSTGVCLVGLR